jgi:N-methylhydantoinase A
MKSNQFSNGLRIGIDIGGTFTDFVIFDPSSGKISTFKLPSTPHDPSEAVLAGFIKINDQLSANSRDSILIQDDLPLIAVIHGSTVATNALLERKGSITALITTQGFKDVIQIGRQNRPDLYDFATRPPDPLIPAELRFELDERVDQFGKVLTALDERQIDKLMAKIKKQKPSMDSIAVVFLFSFANPKHEKTVADKFRSAGYFVSASHEILPEYREFERTSTTVVNAYVSPVLDRYLAKLEHNLNLPSTSRSCSLTVVASA